MRVSTMVIRQLLCMITISAERAAAERAAADNANALGGNGDTGNGGSETAVD